MELTYAIDNVILLLAAVLVLFMQAGFAMLEVGLNAAKNTVNILFKNVMDLCVGVLLFFLIGYGLMYPGNYAEADSQRQVLCLGRDLHQAKRLPQSSNRGHSIPKLTFCFRWPLPLRRPRSFLERSPVA